MNNATLLVCCNSKQTPLFVFITGTGHKKSTERYAINPQKLQPFLKINQQYLFYANKQQQKTFSLDTFAEYENNLWNNKISRIFATFAFHNISTIPIGWHVVWWISKAEFPYSHWSIITLRVFSWLGEIDDRWSGGLGARCGILAGQCWSPSAHDKNWLSFPPCRILPNI